VSVELDYYANAVPCCRAAQWQWHLWHWHERRKESRHGGGKSDLRPRNGNADFQMPMQWHGTQLSCFAFFALL
jgi:hypothetical protein